MSATTFAGYLTLEQAAKRLGITKGSLRRLATAGRAPGVKPPVLNAWVFHRDDLDRFAEGYSRKPGRKARLPWPQERAP